MLIVGAFRAVASNNVMEKKRDTYRTYRTSNFNERLISIGETLARLHLGGSANGYMNNDDVDITIPAILERAVKFLEVVGDSLIVHLSFPVAAPLPPEETKMIKKLENDSSSHYFFRKGFTKWVSWNALTAFEVRNKEVLVPE